VPPSYSTTSLAVSGSLDTTTLGLSERHLKKQGLECLVAILKSLVAWGTVANKAPDSTEPTTRSRTSEDGRADTLTPDGSRDRLSLSYPEVARQPSPIVEVQDDPTRFENAKQKKTTLLEGIKKFNTKPKKVTTWPPLEEPSSCIEGYRILHRNRVHREYDTPRHSRFLTAHGWS
jgi:brefeldin A-inhibited guanine nucleotide-exchange protein